MTKEILIKDLDSLFEDAGLYVVKHQKASVSFFGRHFKMGYNRSQRLLTQLEQAGIIGKDNGVKARDILVKDKIELYGILATIKNVTQEDYPF